MKQEEAKNHHFSKTCPVCNIMISGFYKESREKEHYSYYPESAIMHVAIGRRFLAPTASLINKHFLEASPMRPPQPTVYHAQ